MASDSVHRVRAQPEQSTKMYVAAAELPSPEQVLSQRRGVAAERVRQYATNKEQYAIETARGTKAVLDAQREERSRAVEREQRLRSAEHQLVMNGAFTQERRLQAQVGARQAAQREAAAYNMRLAEERRAARHQSRAAESAAKPEASFFDRFGTTLA